MTHIFLPNNLWQVINEKSQHIQIKKKYYVFFSREKQAHLFMLAYYSRVCIAFSMAASRIDGSILQSYFARPNAKSLFHLLTDMQPVNRCDAALKREFLITSATSTPLTLQNNEFDF